MFGTLVESNPQIGRRRGMVGASAAVHAGVILLAVWATASGGERALPAAATPDDRLDATYLQPPEHRAVEPATTSSHARLAETTVADPLPAAPAGPLIDIPTGIPPVDVPLGDPFAASHAPAIVGTRAGDGAPVPSGSVLDNRIADKPALPLEDNAPPVYPGALRAAGIEGEVELEFVIDPSGRVRAGSIVAVRADHPHFLQSVRDALRGYRYLPAEVGGQAVAVRVRQKFTFAIDR